MELAGRPLDDAGNAIHQPHHGARHLKIEELLRIDAREQLRVPALLQERRRRGRRLPRVVPPAERGDEGGPVEAGLAGERDGVHASKVTPGRRPPRRRRSTASTLTAGRCRPRSSRGAWAGSVPARDGPWRPPRAPTGSAFSDRDPRDPPGGSRGSASAPADRRPARRAWRGPRTAGRRQERRPAGPPSPPAPPPRSPSPQAEAATPPAGRTRTGIPRGPATMESPRRDEAVPRPRAALTGRAAPIPLQPPNPRGRGAGRTRRTHRMACRA